MNKFAGLQKHNDFDALMAELESDPANAQELAAASAWVADIYYAHEGKTLRTTNASTTCAKKGTQPTPPS